MSNFLVVIVGGSSFDSEIKDLFESHNLYVEHYDARKSSSLKKQTVPKNTLGVIVTVNRSHMVFGNSNELTRQLKNDNIPFVFSSGNLATYNSAKILLQKMNKTFPENVKIKESIPQSIQKIEIHKQEWEKVQKNFNQITNKWFNLEIEWNEKLSFWKTILENWKLYLLDWKDIQTLAENKDKKKKIQTFASHLIMWKSEVHNFGLQIERNINVLKIWKENIEEYLYDVLTEYEEIKLFINSIKDLNEKSVRADFRNWKVKFEKWQESIELFEKEFLEWFELFPDTFGNIDQWRKATDVWYDSVKKF